ncbi:lysophospholipid acyltransferase family protein [Chachezhania sediminis]|uniref:lysophospholipid acyltransferase family protein n=1 Tax=Chachezhania sediminis TaxID=2599291 RepID=UPI00131E6325|nr:lysophospholipid acyltransferase family protein [Chachezhania sediminis]
MPVDPSTLSRGQRFGYYTSTLAVRGMLGLLRLVPYEKRIATMGWIVSNVFAGPAGFRRRIRRNLAMTCPDLPEDEVRRLCRTVPDNAARSMAELFSGDEFRARADKWPVTGPGVEAAVEAQAAGRPIIFVTGHIGNYDAARVGVRGLGVGFGVLYRRMANPYFNDIYVEAMLGNGGPLFEQGRKGMSQLFRHLRGGGNVAIAADLYVQGGQVLQFFGQPAVTSTASAEMALKFDALLIPAYGIRQPNGLDFEIELHDPIPHTDPVTMTQAMNDDLEALVRTHMDQWYWIHRRWKQ